MLVNENEITHDINNVNDQIPLWQLFENGVGLIFCCKICRRKQDLNLPQLILKHGSETTVRFIRDSHICNCK